MLSFILNSIFLIVFIPTVTHAKLRMPISDSDYVDHNDVIDFTDDYFYDEEEDEPMRVVDACYGLDNIVLRFASLKEESTIEKSVGHIMEGYKYRVQGVTKTVLPSPYEDIPTRNVQTELETTINNFLLSLPLDPDLYSTDISNEDTEILIYYRSYIEILVIKSGQKQWNYVLGSHSTLPDWFYENGVTDKRDIPDMIKKQFFIRFMSKIKTLLNNLHL